MVGLSHPSAKVLARDAKTIAIKVPARTYATGPRGLGRNYSSAETLVFAINRSLGEQFIPFSGNGEVLEVAELLRWSHGNTSKA